MLVFFSYCRFPLNENMFTSSGEIIFRKLTSFGSAGLTGMPPCYNCSVLGQEVGNKMKCQFSSKSLHRDYRIIFYSVSSINFIDSIEFNWGGEWRQKQMISSFTGCLLCARKCMKHIIVFISFDLFSNAAHYHLHLT